MNFRHSLFAFGSIITAVALPTAAFGEDSAASASASDANVQVDANGVPAASQPAEDGPQYGVELRLRHLWLPKGILELFVDRASGSSAEFGFGADFVRRKDNFELHFGIEFDPINVPAGIWVEKNKPIPANEADYVEFNGFGWVAVEANFISHHPFSKSVALRYGGGAGAGILLGDVTHRDRVCTSSDPASCTIPAAGDTKIKYDLKSPIYPVITGLIGVQYRPTPQVTVNLEAGIRTVLPFVGLSAGYFF